MLVIVLIGLCFLSNALATCVDPECIITSYDQVEGVMKSCSVIELGTFEVPAGKTLFIQPLDNSLIYVTGNVSFTYHQWAGPLVQLNASGLTMVGKEGSVFDGHGPLYWDGSGEWGSLKPRFFFVHANHSRFENLRILDSPRHYIRIIESNNVTFTGMTLDNLKGDVDVAGPDHAGHNSDGFDVHLSYNVTIEHSKIYNQDDCVALNSGSGMHVHHLYCHGGHGLSLSVGFSNTSVELNSISNVLIEDCEVDKGRNAIHVKTHVDAGEGTISNVTYKNIWFHDQTVYGINIQQNYKNLPKNSTQPAEATDNIPIIDLNLINVIGTVNSDAVGVYINCANNACLNWKWHNVTVRNATNDCNFQPEGYVC